MAERRELVIAAQLGLERIVSAVRAGAVVALPARGQWVYRTIGRSEARERDFLSDRDKERPRFPTQDHADYLGVSVFATEDAAKENAALWPKHVARVRLEAGRGFMIARTYADVDHHYTVWADPEDLLDLVEGVSRFDEPG